MKHLRIAFKLLTTLPIRDPADWQLGDSGLAAVWYPFVGWVLGLLVEHVETIILLTLTA